MIPRVIHYCWFSGDKMPPLVRDCIRSWKERLPNYQIVLWDGNSFDFQSIPYLKKCIELRKWAFAADYIRLYAVYTYGGIYLDSDVKVLKSFDEILSCNAFWGIDVIDEQNYYFPEAAIFGADKGFKPLKEMMQYYEQMPEQKLNVSAFNEVKNLTMPENHTIYDSNQLLHLVTAPVVMASVLEKYGFKHANENQKIGEGIQIYGQPFFMNSTLVDTNETIAHHMNAASWFDDNRGPIYQFCKRHSRLMPLYKRIENEISNHKKI